MAKDYTVIKTFFGQEKNAARTASVLVKYNEEKNDYGVQLYLDTREVAIEWYEGHSIHYAEDAAENYILGIKNLV